MRSALVAIVFAVAACSGPAAPAPRPPPPPPPVRPLVSVVLLDLDCDDASEDQANALTAALRSRVTAAHRWRLDAARPSMAALIPAMSCPRPPDSACLDRISKQLDVDHYFWGTVKTSPVPDSVVAELHYWGRGEAEHVVRETYSSNLTDQNDDALRRIAAQLIDRLERYADPP